MKNRIISCIKKIKALNLDGLIISNPVNTTYLTGFRNAPGYLLLTTQNELVYFTNFIYRNEAEKNFRWEVDAGSENIFRRLAKKIQKNKLFNLGFEAKHLPFLEQQTLKDLTLNSGLDLTPTCDLIEQLRALKSLEELKLMRTAAQISQEALAFAKQIATSQMTEKGLTIEIEKFLKIKADLNLAFPSIVASGPNSAIVHHVPNQTRLAKNSLLVDLGARFQGYCADLTRVFFWGKMPPLTNKIYNIVQKAQALSIKAIRDGATIKAVDQAARNYIEKKGYGRYFGHGLGHGVGLEVHEQPYINPTNNEKLKEGMVITVEPAIYLPNHFGIRIEDMILVTKNKGVVLNGHSVNW